MEQFAKLKVEDKRRFLREVIDNMLESKRWENCFNLMVQELGKGDADNLIEECLNSY